MQTIFIISIFSLIMTVISGIISMGTSNTAQLTEQRVVETKQFFQSIAKVALNDITMEYMHGNPNGSTTPEAYISNLSEVKRLSSGRLTNPALDAWGQTIQGAIITEYQSLTTSTDSNNKVVVPVTGYLLVSGGPDRIIQTVIPPITNVGQIYSVVVPTNATGVPQNDDIIYSFDNRNIQQQILASIKARLNRIGTAALKELQVRISSYRQAKLTAYQAQVAAGQEGNLNLLDLSTDASAPRFLALDDTAQGLINRRQLGVDEEFEILEREIGSGGRFVLSAPQPGSATAPLVIGVANASNKKTPWGTTANPFKFQIKVSITSS